MWQFQECCHNQQSYFMILFDIIKTDLLRISGMESEYFKADLNVLELYRVGEINVEIC